MEIKGKNVHCWQAGKMGGDVLSIGLANMTDYPQSYPQKSLTFRQAWTPLLTCMKTACCSGPAVFRSAGMKTIGRFFHWPI
ncbi:MAG: hypothetical protein AB1899_08545 [Pseudomonadota bacterium]